MQDMEFTVEHGKLYMLQTRNGKRTAQAALKIACDLVDEGMRTEEEAVAMIDPRNLDTLLHPQFDAAALKAATPMSKALGASPGAACGKIVFTADDAVEWAARGEKVILVRLETSPEDITGMKSAQGILTVRGGMTSHAAVVARGMGTVSYTHLDVYKRQAISEFLGEIFTAININRYLFWTTVTSGVINVLSIHLLLPILGVQGASIALLVGFLVNTIARLFILRKKIAVHLDVKFICIFILLVGIAISIYNSGSIVLNIVNFIVMAGVALYIFKDVLVQIIQSIKNKKQASL